MRRTALTAAALALGLSLAPALASADDTPMCAEGMVPMSLPSWLLPTMLDTAERAAPTPSPLGTDVLWCTSAYDTRCSPAPADAGGLFSSLLHSFMAPALLVRTSVPAPPVQRATFADVRHAPTEGARSRLDRPPR